MQTPEGRIVACLVNAVKARGWEQRKVSYEARAGAPDRLILAPGYHCFIEVKAPGMKPRPLQEKEHERLRRSGFNVFVVDSELAVRSIVGYIASVVEHSRLRIGDKFDRAQPPRVKVTRRYGGEETF